MQWWAGSIKPPKPDWMHLEDEHSLEVATLLIDQFVPNLFR